MVLAVDFAPVGPWRLDASVEGEEVVDIVVVLVVLVVTTSSSSSFAGVVAVVAAAAAEEAEEAGVASDVHLSVAVLMAVMVPVSCGIPALDLWLSSWSCRWCDGGELENTHTQDTLLGPQREKMKRHVPGPSHFPPWQEYKTERSLGSQKRIGNIKTNSLEERHAFEHTTIAHESSASRAT